MATDGLVGALDESCSCVFGLPVALVERTAHDDLHELVDIFLDGGATCDHQSNPPSEAFSHLAENYLVVEA